MQNQNQQSDPFYRGGEDPQYHPPVTSGSPRDSSHLKRSFLVLLFILIMLMLTGTLVLAATVYQIRQEVRQQASRTDADTTYSPGEGIGFSGTRIDNIGVLSFAVADGSGLTKEGNEQNISLKLQDCRPGEVLQFGTHGWECAAVGSGSSATTVPPSSGAFSLMPCPAGQVLRSTGADNYACSDAAVADTDTNTTYSGGSGLNLSGTSFSNAGVLAIASATTGGNANSPLTIGGTIQQPTIGFAGGSAAGQFWQWNGTEWELAQLPPGTVEQDGIVGNEVTGVTGANSGLTRSGAGTSVSPYTLAVNVGTGLAINGSNQITNTGVLSFNLGTSGALLNNGTAQNPLIDLKPCADGETLRYETATSTWECATPSGGTTFAITDGTTTQSVTNGSTVTFVGNEGLVAAVSATDTVTYGIANGGVTTIKIADGSIVTTKLDDGAVITAKLADGAVTSDKILDGSIANTDLANNSLTVTAGDGLTGGGVVALGAGTTLTLMPCSANQILKYNGGSGSWECAADTDTNTDDQTLSISNAPGSDNTITYSLSIESGNTIQFDDRDTLYTAATNGGLALNGQAFSLQTCPVGQILKSTNATTPTYACAADADTDTNTIYSAGTGLSLSGTTFNINVGTGLNTDGSNNLINSGVLTVGSAGAIASSGGQNPNISLNTSSNFTQTGNSLDLTDSGASAGTYGDSGVNVTQLTVDAKGRLTAVSNRTLPTASASVTGVLSSSDFATFAGKENALTFNAPLSRAGNTISFVLTGSGTTSTTSSASGLEFAGGGLSLLRGCSNNQLLKWNSSTSVWACGSDIDTNTDAQTLSFDNGTRVLSISGGNTVTIPDANTTYSAGNGLALSGTTFSIDVTGASSGQVLTYTGSGVAWQTASLPTCSVSGTYICQGGNTFGTSMIIGTDDSAPAVLRSGGSGGPYLNVSALSGIVTVGGPSGGFFNTDNIGVGSGLTGSQAVSAIQIDKGNATASAIKFTAGSTTGQTATDGFDIGISSTGAAIINQRENLGISFNTNNTQRLTVDADGDVGINVTNPTEKLHIDGKLRFVSSSETAWTGNAKIFVGDQPDSSAQGGLSGPSLSNISTFGNGASAVNGIVMQWGGTTDASGFKLSDDGLMVWGSGDEDLFALLDEDANAFRMVVDDSGRLGIGLASPAVKVHIDSGTATASTLKFTAGSTTGTCATCGFDMGILSDGTALLNNRPARDLGFATNGTTRMIVKSDGKIAFGNNIAGQTSPMQADFGAGNASYLAFSRGGDAGSFVGIDNGGVLYLSNLLNSSLALGTNSVARLTIDGSGTSTFSGDVFLSSTGTGTAFGLCHSGAQASGAFTNRQIVACSGTAGDMAEWYETKQNVEAGDLVMTTDQSFTYSEELSDPTTGPTGRYAKHTIAILDKGSRTQTGRILGIASTSPHQVFGEAVKNAPGVKNPKPIALNGRVPLKVTNENGPIVAGDPLAASSTPGYAMKATEPSMIVGYALENLRGTSGKIDTFVNIGSYMPPPALSSLKKAAWEGGIVTKDTTFKNNVLFNSPVRFTGKATFNGDVTITGKIKLSGDQVNDIVLPAGKRRVTVTFDGKYQEAPFITATPREFVRGEYRVTAVTKEGFVIEVTTPQRTDVRFDWHAFGKS